MRGVKCPYCGHVIELEHEVLGSNEFDYECDNCDEEFECSVEWIPGISVYKIEYHVCQECKEKKRVLYNHPYDSTVEEKLCLDCLRKIINKGETNERQVQHKSL